MAAVAAFAAIMASAVPALAGNWLGHTAGTNSTVEFDQCSLTTQMHTAFHSNDSHDINPTQITSIGYHNCLIHEVNVIDQNYGTNEPFGWWHCHLYGGVDWCSLGEVHINVSYLYSANDALSLMCEEVGHSVGLDHSMSGLSCMRSVFSNLHLVQHDKDLINANY